MTYILPKNKGVKYMENSQNNIGYFPQMPVCDKHSAVELNSDFSLPDYQPEIRRLLSTRVVFLPHNEYIGNGNAEISGEINYKITYLGADGSIYCTTLSDKYGFNAPLNFNLHNVNNDEVTVIPHCKVESVSTRVLGPRKLNVRAKLNCRVIAYSPSLYTPNLVGAHNKASIENLIVETDCINVKKTATESQILNDFISFDSPSENIRIVDCLPSIIVNECLPSTDKITVRGDVMLKILYCNELENSHPLSLIKKIPFSMDLTCIGVNNLFECVANCVCFDERFDFSENGVSVELTLSTSAFAQRNEKIKYVADAYSTEKVCENSTSDVVITNVLRVCHGNLTQNDVFSLENVKLSPNIKIVDIFGKANINELEIENDKLVFKGITDYQLIYFLDGEYSSINITSPLKYAIDCHSFPKLPNPIKWYAESSVSTLKARNDAERLFVDCELNLSLTLTCENKIEILDEMVFGKFLNKDRAEILLCYPEKNTPLWSVAKQYGEPLRSIRHKNTLPENENIVKRRYLVI